MPNALLTMFAPTRLPPAQENAFMRDMYFAPGYRDWRRDYMNQWGEAPNLNDPGYDYRGAWAANLPPQPYVPDGGHYHWDSQTPAGKDLKAPDHPTRWMQTFMDTYGVDPNEAPPEILADALRRGIIPGDGR